MPWWVWALLGYALVEHAKGAPAPSMSAGVVPPPAAGGPDPHGFATPPAQFAPGVPPPPWRCDHDLPNAGDCGNPGENGNGMLARYLASRWGVHLPADIAGYDCAQLESWLAGVVKSLPLDALLDFNAVGYGCIGRKIGAEITRGWQQAQATATSIAQGTYYVGNPFGGGGLSL